MDITASMRCDCYTTVLWRLDWCSDEAKSKCFLEPSPPTKMWLDPTFVTWDFNQCIQPASGAKLSVFFFLLKDPKLLSLCFWFVPENTLFQKASPRILFWPNVTYYTVMVNLWLGRQNIGLGCIALQRGKKQPEVYFYCLLEKLVILNNNEQKFIFKNYFPCWL